MTDVAVQPFLSLIQQCQNMEWCSLFIGSNYRKLLLYSSDRVNARKLKCSLYLKNGKKKKNGECTMTKDILYVLAQCKNKSSYAVSAADKLLCLYCSFSAVSTAAGFRWSCCILPWVTCWKGSETCFLTHWGHGDQSPGRETCYNLAFGCICSLSLGIGFILFATCSRHSWFHHSSKWVIGHWRAVYWEEWEKVKDRQGHIKAVLVQVL